ncbi:MAG TPA: M23 family metallopeptidase [Candidatus Binatia bacterium]|nr:M23 family metallopeptidase [Candidatus Binatia bacterium]
MTTTPLPSATSLPTVTASEAASPLATEVETTLPDNVEDATPTATELPPPTFTPPATPDESSDDHYWLQRPVAAGGVVWTDKYYPYGSTRGGELRPHHGVEFNVPYNTEILAAAAGTVLVAGSDADVAYGEHTNFYGNLVVIEHDFQYAGQPLFTLYGHLNEVRVSVGQHVSAQEVLGLSGATGIADGPHMHFEVREGSNSYENTRNPLLWLYPFPERGTIAGRITWPDGSPAEGAPVSLSRIDGSSPYYATTTYTGNSINSDDHWQENFALDDVVVGYYEVVVRVGDKKYSAETWVYSYRTSYVEIVIE